MARIQVLLGFLALAAVWVGYTKLPLVMKVRPFEVLESSFVEGAKKKKLSVPAEIESVRREANFAAEALYEKEQSMISDSWQFISVSLVVFGACSIASGVWAGLKKEPIQPPETTRGK
jgi:hypothetical protein